MKYKPYRLPLYILIKSISLLLYPLPLKMSTRIGGALGKLVFFILPKEREKTLNHLRIAFGREKSEKDLRQIALNLFSNLGKNAVEWVNFPKIDLRWFSKNVTPEGHERVIKARKKGKGIIILVSHFGNWELLGAYLAQTGCPGTIIARRIYIEQINRFIVNIRKRLGNDVMYRDESPKKMMRILKGGGCIGLLGDQDVASVEGIFVDFFGKSAYTPVAPVKFAMKTGAALVPVYLAREGGRFRFYTDGELEMDVSADKEKDIRVNTEKWVRCLEEKIRRYPDHWVWMHRRWKTRPKEEGRPVTASQMQLIDKAAQEDLQIPGITLMENAGVAAASLAMEILGAKTAGKKKVSVFCGKGNNGGDGFVISRKLIEKGLDITTYMLCEETELKKDPSYYFSQLKGLGANIIILNKRSALPSVKSLSGCSLIIDAVFGTGFKGRPRGIVSSLIKRINKSGSRVLSIDVPSGLDATTGEYKGACIKATETVTFGLPKAGFYRLGGLRFTGRITVKNIGFPDSLLSNPPN